MAKLPSLWAAQTMVEWMLRNTYKRSGIDARVKRNRRYRSAGRIGASLLRPANAHAQTDPASGNSTCVQTRLLIAEVI
jgi:hypothetical protein